MLYLCSALITDPMWEDIQDIFNHPISNKMIVLETDIWVTYNLELSLSSKFGNGSTGVSKNYNFFNRQINSQLYNAVQSAAYVKNEISFNYAPKYEPICTMIWEGLASLFYIE